MKAKKLSLTSKILLSAVFCIALILILFSVAKKPTVTEGEFPFSITYELDGESVTIKDVYKARYVKNGGYADSKFRIYEGEIGNMGVGNTIYTLKKEENGRIELWTHFYADYLMGDTEYDYFDDSPFEPKIYYFDSEEQEHVDEETLSEHGVKLIGFEYPTPIENKLVFSHFSHFSAVIAFPMLLIALLALLAIMIFVKKEKELKYKAVDVISIILNFILFFILLPIVTIFALFIDIEGGGPEFYYQAVYFIPTLTTLGIAASVSLRRKGNRIKSLLVGLTGPVAIALYTIICAIIGI